MKIASIVANVERIRSEDGTKTYSDTPDGWHDRFDSQRRSRQLSKVTNSNPRRQIDDHMDASRNMQKLGGVTVIGIKE